MWYTDQAAYINTVVSGLSKQDAGYAVTIYKRKCKRKKGSIERDPYLYLGRYRGHYKPIVDMMFGTKLDSTQPRFLTLGEDRYLVSDRS